MKYPGDQLQTTSSASVVLLKPLRPAPSSMPAHRNGSPSISAEAGMLPSQLGEPSD